MSNGLNVLRRCVLNRNKCANKVYKLAHMFLCISDGNKREQSERQMRFGSKYTKNLIKQQRSVRFYIARIKGAGCFII